MRLPGSTKMTLSMLAVAVALVSLLARPTAAASAPQRVVAYMTSWQIYSRGTFPVDMIKTGQADRLTHLIYAFAGVSENGSCIALDTWSDYQRAFSAAESIAGVEDPSANPLKGSMNQVKLFKEKYPKVRTSLALGGWTHSKYFSIAARTPESRTKYVSSCVDKFIKGNLVANSSLAGVFDGIDLDWEWPTLPGGGPNVVHPNDGENYAALAQEFRSQLDAYGKEVGRKFEISSFLPADPRKVDVVVKDGFMDAMDFVTIPGYDFRGTHENYAAHQGNLYIPDEDPAPGGRIFSIEQAVDKMLCVGAPADKLVVGVPGYGRGWANVVAGDRNGLYQKSVNESAPPVTTVPPVSSRWQDYVFVPGAIKAKGKFANGSQNYKDLIKQNLPMFTDNDAGATWGYDGNEFWTFDTPEMIKVKMGWANKRGLGGAMMWSIDNDNGDIIKAMDDGLKATAGTYCSSAASESTIKSHVLPQRCKQMADGGKEGAAGKRKQLDKAEAVARTGAC